jgi:SulP family sulfate permease
MLIWLRNYRRDLLAGDIGAGIIVTLMMIPQSMAYALVAGLPPVTGLYASILPPVAYALFGSSMVQSVGPMAITSLMIGTALATLAPQGSALSMVLAGQMALIAGAILFLSGVFRLGFVAGFLSRPVMSGFTTGAALLIANGQLGPLLGGPLANIHLPSAIIGLASLLALWLAKTYLARALAALGASGKVAEMLTKLAPVVVLIAATAAVAVLDLAAAGVKVVGEIPAGLPALALAVSAEHWQPLLMPSLLIAFMIFLSSQSAAQSLAHRRGERIVSNRELLGLGAANLASAVSGGFAVTGSISRSAVNYAAGANTPLASIISAGLIVLALLVPTTWISWLPLPALAATIILAVLGMIDVATLRDAWRHDRSDAAALLATTAGVLVSRRRAGSHSRRRPVAGDGHLARQPAAHRGHRPHSRQRALPQRQTTSGRNPARSADAAHRRRSLLRQCRCHRRPPRTTAQGADGKRASDARRAAGHVGGEQHRHHRPLPAQRDQSQPARTVHQAASERSQGAGHGPPAAQRAAQAATRWTRVSKYRRSLQLPHRAGCAGNLVHLRVASETKTAPA